jgi:outer membrane protein OmpA-like peptidoglycan-associated protein
VKGGLPFAGSDVRYWGPTGGFGVHLRKSLGYVFSIRAEFDLLRMKGLNWQPSQAWQKNSVLASYYTPGQYVFYNYQSTVHELSLQGVASLTNITFHRNSGRLNVYVFGGIAAMTYSTFYKVLDKNGKPYDYSGIMARFSGQFDYKHRKDIRNALKDLLNGPWSTMAERDHSQGSLGGAPLRLAAVVGAGIQLKLNSRFSLSLEDKFTSPKTDLLDGQQWQENGNPSNASGISQTRDYDAYNFVSLGINYSIGRAKRRVEPLWWRNPLDYAYGELNAPRHMKLPKPVLDDTDGDGVPDQLDKEPHTPAGCPVDSHGVSRDTDGDGVPDCLDRELITPTRCQPVDANGVGKCPEPDCCKEISALKDRLAAGGEAFSSGTAIKDMPSITFKEGSTRLSTQDKIFLDETAKKMRENPGRKVAVIGYGGSSKLAQQTSWDRVNAVINYLIEKEGISPDRFIFRYGQSGGEENTIDIIDATGEQGPNTLPAPHPALRKRSYKQ